MIEITVECQRSVTVSDMIREGGSISASLITAITVRCAAR